MENSADSLSKIVEDQKKTIEAYTNKLRDVVEAYKSLLVEKKALEETLKILNAEKVSAPSGQNSSDEKITESSVSDLSEDELKSKLSVVLTSMSNLVAEKTHMEDGFKSKQKQLLEDKRKVENKCEELEKQVEALTRQLKSIEIKNSELSQTKKDFQRSVKNLIQTSDKDKSKSSDGELLFLQVKNYEKEVRNLKSELDGKQIVYDTLEKKYSENRKDLARLQEDFKNLQIEHEMAISAEKQKTKSVEENARKLTAIQEQRVNDLEARLATLSETIGTYDRQKLQDQLEIQKLKEHIAFIDIGSERSVVNQEKSETVDSNDYDSLKEKFLDMVKKLNLAAQKSNKEDDFKSLFSINSHKEDTHLSCERKYAKLESEFQSFKNDVRNCSQEKSGEVIRLQNHIQSLQETVKSFSDKNEESLKDYKLQIEQLKANLQNEKKKFQQIISTTKANHKQKIWQLEEQLQKQRERSKALLEDKSQEIQTLQGTFQMFLPGYRRKSEDDSPSVESNLLTKSEVDGPHIVHYANELARKDVEISSLRKSKHKIEMNLRELQKEAASNLEKHKEEKTSLLNEIARLERYESTAGTKMEYLKNIVYNFLESDDPEWRIHLCKAIAAVVKFTDAESESIIAKHKLRRKR